MLNLPNFRQKQIIFVFSSRKEKISFHNDNITIKSDDGIIKHQSSCYKLFSVFIVGNTSITSGLLKKIENFHFSLILMTHSLRPYLFINPRIKGNTLLISKQYQYQDSKIGIYMVKNKIENQISILKNIRNKSDSLKIKIKRLEKLKEGLNSFNILNNNRILSIEGICARIYFQELFRETNWIGRKPRTKINPINTLMDLGYTLLFHFVESLLNCYGFDVYKGIYHKDFYQRKSLVCDLVEPFRVIIDRKIKNAYSLKQIKEEDFFQNDKRYILFYKEAKIYIQLFLEEILKYKTNIFLYIQQYYRFFMKGSDIQQYPYFDINESPK